MIPLEHLQKAMESCRQTGRTTKMIDSVVSWVGSNLGEFYHGLGRQRDIIVYGYSAAQLDYLQNLLIERWNTSTFCKRYNPVGYDNPTRKKGLVKYQYKENVINVWFTTPQHSDYLLKGLKISNVFIDHVVLEFELIEAKNKINKMGQENEDLSKTLANILWSPPLTPPEPKLTKNDVKLALKELLQETFSK